MSHGTKIITDQYEKHGIVLFLLFVVFYNLKVSDPNLSMNPNRRMVYFTWKNTKQQFHISDETNTVLYSLKMLTKPTFTYNID